MMDVLPISWPNKVNSPALTAIFKQFGTEEYLSAEEINTIVEAINTLHEAGEGSGIKKKYFHFAQTISFTGTTNLSQIMTFDLPALYKENRRIRISGRMISTGSGLKSVNVKSNTTSLANILHSINGTNIQNMPFVRNIIFLNNQYSLAAVSGGFYNDEVSNIPQGSFSTEEWKKTSTVQVLAQLATATDKITGFSITFEIFDEE